MIDLTMVAVFLFGLADLLSAFAGGIGIVALGFSVIYAISVYGITIFRRLTGI
ncbi:MAG: hypothetical protein ABJM58_06685 [Alteripontixanthobacter sp.]